MASDLVSSGTINTGGSGGAIGPVSYGSKEPLARRLASFGVDISKAPSIEALYQGVVRYKDLFEAGTSSSGAASRSGSAR